MAISYPRAIVSTPGIRRNRWGLEFNEDVFESPITKTKHVNNRPGARWEGVYTLPPMTTAQAREWTAWFASLQGSTKTFFGFDPDGRDPVGIADTGSDTPLVSGGGQTGSTLLTKGWRNTGTGLLVPGDYFQIATGSSAELKLVIETFSSDGSGNGTINFEPPLHTPPSADVTIIFNDPVGVFRNSDSVPWDSNETGLHGFSWAIEEKL